MSFFNSSVLSDKMSQPYSNTFLLQTWNKLFSQVALLLFDRVAFRTRIWELELLIAIGMYVVAKPFQWIELGNAAFL